MRMVIVYRTATERNQSQDTWFVVSKMPGKTLPLESTKGNLDTILSYPICLYTDTSCFESIHKQFPKIYKKSNFYSNRQNLKLFQEQLETGQLTALFNVTFSQDVPKTKTPSLPEQSTYLTFVLIFLCLCLLWHKILSNLNLYVDIHVRLKIPVNLIYVQDCTFDVEN